MNLISGWTLKSLKVALILTRSSLVRAMFVYFVTKICGPVVPSIGFSGNEADPPGNVTSPVERADPPSKSRLLSDTFFMLF